MQSQKSQPQPQPQLKQSREEKLFFNSLSLEFTKTNYKVYLDKYLQVVGYKDLNELLAIQLRTTWLILLYHWEHRQEAETTSGIAVLTML